MSTNADEFNRQVKKLIADWEPNEIHKFQRFVILEVLRRVVLKTPVDTGRARGNWQVTIGKYPVTQTYSKDKSGNDVIAKGSGVAGKAPPFSIVFITNNVPYIEALENGSSKQAPAGMVSVTIQEMLAMFP